MFKKSSIEMIMVSTDAHPNSFVTKTDILISDGVSEKTF